VLKVPLNPDQSICYGRPFCLVCQVSQLGMSDRVGNISFEMPQSGDVVVTKPYSEQTAQIIDEEVRSLIKTAYDSAFKLLSEHKADIEKVSNRVIFLQQRLSCGGCIFCMCLLQHVVIKHLSYEIFSAVVFPFCTLI